MRLPLLSIVIANYNYGRFLEEAIRSVVEQDGFDQCELVIVDGGSTDNSVEIIRKYADKIAWWCTEKDRGQSAAFNKGFSHARGRYLTWLNADDIYLPHALRQVINMLQRTNADWATANFVRFDRVNRKITEAKWGPHWLPRWMQGNGWPVAAYGPTTFWKRSVYEKLGPIREDFAYAMDTEYWTRMYMAGIKQVRINVPCWGFGMHLASKTAEFDGHSCSEQVKERQREEELLRHTINGYREHPLKVLFSKTWRILDGSFLVQLLRRYFVVGRTVELIKERE